MRRSKALLAAMAASAVTMAVPSVGLAQSPWYVGASLGQSQLKDACNNIPSCDDKDTAFRILGGYQINRNFAAELGYHELGKASASGQSFKANAWELVGIGSYPIANQFSIYGKLGFFRGEAKASGTKETNSDLTYGAGVQYDFARNLGVRGEWQRYGKLGGGTLVESDVDVLSVGVVWKF
jgi:OmpA-OmpF porin, OOP family